jgi:hypothetical protein
LPQKILVNVVRPLSTQWLHAITQKGDIVWRVPCKMGWGVGPGGFQRIETARLSGYACRRAHRAVPLPRCEWETCDERPCMGFGAGARSRGRRYANLTVDLIFVRHWTRQSRV